MAKKNARKSYFILGKNCSVFWDPSAKLKVVSKNAKQPDEFEGAWSKRIELAVKSGHIISVEEPEPTAETVAPKTPSKPAEPAKVEAEDEDDEDESSDEETEESEEETEGTDFEAMDDAQLQKYYEDTYDVTAKDKKAFAKMSKADKIKLLQE